MGWTQCSDENLVQIETGLPRRIRQGPQPPMRGATDKPFSQAVILVMLPATHDMMDALAGLLDNLALGAITNRTTVQQL
jgi:hypothetical protein